MHPPASPGKRAKIGTNRPERMRDTGTGRCRGRTSIWSADSMRSLRAKARLSNSNNAFFDPGIEWVPPPQSPLAVDTYRGFDGVRRYWGEFLSTWDEYGVEALKFDDAGGHVAVVVHIFGSTHGLEVDETRSSLLTI